LRSIRRILLVTGSRRASFPHYQLVEKHLRAWDPQLIIHGGCVGFDILCEEWAVANGVPFSRFDTPQQDKERYGGRAFTMRNTTMVEHVIDTYCEQTDDGLWIARHTFVVGCMAFPGGGGTDDCAGKWLEYANRTVTFVTTRKLQFIDLRGEPFNV